MPRQRAVQRCVTPINVHELPHACRHHGDPIFTSGKPAPLHGACSQAPLALQDRGDIRMEIDHKCAYGPCQCKVAQLGEYCSDHCSQADKLRRETTQCSCGHDACKAAGNP
jgi:hypothetical protein